MKDREQRKAQEVDEVAPILFWLFILCLGLCVISWLLGSL